MSVLCFVISKKKRLMFDKTYMIKIMLAWVVQLKVLIHTHL